MIPTVRGHCQCSVRRAMACVRLVLCLCLALALCSAEPRRGGGGGGRRGGGGSFGRGGSSSSSGSSIWRSIFKSSSSSSSSSTNHGSPSYKPSAPKYPEVPKTTGPIGFERFAPPKNQGQGNHKIGFDNLNSDVLSKIRGSHSASAPPYPMIGAPVGPPPAYYPGHSGYGFGDHPPAYPGRPVNAPPSYSSNPHYPRQTYPSQSGYGNNHYPGQNYYGNSHGSNTGNQYVNTYPRNVYGGSPFGGNGYTGFAYNPSHFGYSSNPGYFGYQGYPGQQSSYHKRSGLGGLPIPIPVPIPIHTGRSFGSSYRGFGGYHDYHSYNHRVLDTFINTKENVDPLTSHEQSADKTNSSTSVFILNNSTVTPCTTDHFVYDSAKITTIACTAEHCTAIKVLTSTNVSNVVSLHSASLTMCLENNVTFTYHGDNVTPTVSELQQESLTVCRDVPKNTTGEAVKSEEATTIAAPERGEITTTEVTTTQETPTVPSPTTSSTVSTNTTKVCETVNCTWVEMCLPAVEVVDQCNTVDCPFRRTGYQACVKIKMCSSPSAPVSSFATINTTISKIDEFQNHTSFNDVANLTLISYHQPVISFNCSNNESSPGCPPPSTTPQTTKSPRSNCKNFSSGDTLNMRMIQDFQNDLKKTFEEIFKDMPSMRPEFPVIDLPEICD